ncbi:hypothetical protein BVRB_8g192080 [Beta vulgaris subsp. vulgaris]|nr:hypothetical protein BVRB_8g192080 [Beta vulgaris subsp. vulgaris]
MCRREFNLFWMVAFLVPVVYNHEDLAKDVSGILPLPKQSGIVIRAHGDATAAPAYGKLPPPPVHGKGKGKMVVMHPVVSDDSSDDEATLIAPLVPLNYSKHAGFEIEQAGDSTAPMCSPAPIRVFSPSDILSVTQDQSPLGLTVNCLQAINEDENNDTTLLVTNGTSGSLGEFNSLVDHSFHSLHSDSSIVRHIEQMGVDPAFPVTLSSQSGSVRRRDEDMESDDASSALKRKRN